MKQTTNQIVKNMIKVWFEVKNYIKKPKILYQYSPVWGNQHFTPGRADAIFRTWASNGLEKIQDLYLPNSDNMMSFEEIKHEYDIDKKINNNNFSKSQNGL